MAKRQKKKHGKTGGHGPELGPTEVAGKLAVAVAERRDRQAWSLARQLLAASDKPGEFGGPICAALELRARRLVQENNLREALGMVDAFLGSHADLAAAIGTGFRLFLELRGGPPKLLANYGADREADAPLNQALLVELRDPQALWSTARLPAEHPLVVQARLVWQAWEALEGKAPDAAAALAALSGIPRMSPLAPWRLLVQALAAFYGGDDERCQANLQRIPGDSGAAPVARLVADLLAGRASKAPGSAALVKEVYREDFATQVQVVLGPEAASQPVFFERVCALVNRAVAAGRPGLGVDLLVLGTMAKPSILSHPAAIERSLPFLRDRNKRFWSLFSVRIEKYINVSNQLADEIEEMLDLSAWSPLEVAVARRQQAKLWLEQARHFDGGNAFARADLCFRHSVAAMPLRNTFAQWLAASRRFAVDEREPARDWVKAFPDDERPLLIMLDDARRRRDPRGMAAMYLALTSVAAGHEAFEIRRSLAVAELAVTLAEKGRQKEAAKWLERLPADDIGWPAIARLGAAYLTAARRDKPALGNQLGQLHCPLAVWLAFWCLNGGNTQTPALPSSVRQALDDAAGLVASMRLLAELRDPLWREMAIEEFLAAAPGNRLERGNFTATEAAALLAGLFDLVPHGSPPLYGIAFVLTRIGLVAATPNKPAVGQHLAYRAWTTGVEYMWDFDQHLPQRAQVELAELLTAATLLIEEQGETPKVVARIAAELELLDYRERAGEMTASRIAQIVDREAGRRSAGCYFAAWREPARRPSRAGNRRPPRQRRCESLEPFADDLDGRPPEPPSSPPPRKPAKAPAAANPQQPTFDFFDDLNP